MLNNCRFASNRCCSPARGGSDCGFARGKGLRQLGRSRSTSRLRRAFISTRVSSRRAFRKQGRSICSAFILRKAENTSSPGAHLINGRDGSPSRPQRAFEDTARPAVAPYHASIRIPTGQCSPSTGFPARCIHPTRSIQFHSGAVLVRVRGGGDGQKS
jgi:hypothetical protein